VKKFVRVVSRAYYVFLFGLTTISASLLFLMASVNTFDILQRKIAGISIIGLNSAISIGLMFIVFLALADTEVQGRHVSITILASRIPPKALAILQSILFFLCFTWAGYLAYAISLDVAYTMKTTSVWSSELLFPKWIVRLVIPIGLGLIATQFLIESIEKIRYFLR